MRKRVALDRTDPLNTHSFECALSGINFRSGESRQEKKRRVQTFSARSRASFCGTAWNVSVLSSHLSRQREHLRQASTLSALM